MLPRTLAGLVLLVATAAPAADHPVAVERLLLRDASHPRGAKVALRVSGEPDLAPALLADPRVLGATLEIVGSTAGDGASGVVPLPPAGWHLLGTENAPTGYEYEDPDRTLGVRRVVLSAGGLSVNGGTDAWPYVIAAPQGAIDVRFELGADVFCARLESFAANTAGRVLARDADAPPTCAPRSERCGNRVVEPGEECDDGNPATGDGCSPECRLTDPSAVCAGVEPSVGNEIRTQLVAGGLDSPTFVTAPPLDLRRVFVVEQPGRIRVIQDGILLATPFLDISDKVGCCNERGLLSMAFHPDYATNRRFFVYYTDNRGRLVLARFRASAGDPNVADLGKRRVLLRIKHPTFANHNGGQLAFGPDGYLYMGTGDGGGGGDPRENAQDDTSLLGKLLRIDVDVSGRPPRGVPPDNPDPGAGPRRGLIWAKGLRNPWRFSFDRATGDLYVGDVGQGSREEVDVQPASSAGGENYGWDFYEGTSCFEPEPVTGLCPAPGGFVFPVTEYSHDDGCSITGGYVYRGCALPALHGTYFYSDFCSSFVRTFRGVSGGLAQNPADRTAELAPGGGLALDNVVSFGEDARGEIYVADRDGEIYRIVADGS